jgi:hypothetical protein
MTLGWQIVVALLFVNEVSSGPSAQASQVPIAAIASPEHKEDVTSTSPCYRPFCAEIMVSGTVAEGWFPFLLVAPIGVERALSSVGLTA